LRLPALYPSALYPKAGGLISYGPDLVTQFQQGAGYVDRILRGAKPADLPVQYPTKYQLVINLKTAKALGLTLPDRLSLPPSENSGQETAAYRGNFGAHDQCHRRPSRLAVSPDEVPAIREQPAKMVSEWRDRPRENDPPH
jgi:hypothetical protein